MKSHVKLLIFCFLLFIALTLVGCLKFGQLVTPSLPNSTSLQKGILYLEPASYKPTIGESFKIELKASSIENLKGYSVILSYDPAILRLGEIVEGPCLSEENETFFWKKIDSVKGTIQIDCAILGTKISTYGEGSLAILYFTVLEKGNIEVDFDQTQTRDTYNQPILTTQKSARIRCK
jgi:hypothetical protein